MPRPASEATVTGGASRTHVPALVFALLGLAFLIGVLTIFKMSNNDIWIHLKTGENILRTWSVPDKDPYSFTASDHDYVAHEWLSGVLFHIVYAAGGVNGLIYFKSAVIFLTCAFLYLTGRFLKVAHVILFPCFIAMLFTGSARFLERPHIFSYLFVALYLFCWFGYKTRGRRRAWLWAIPVLHIFWTNLHGGHFQGILLLGVLAAAETASFVRARSFGLATDDAVPPRDLALIVALPFASLATALVNPYGYRLLTFPFELTGQDVFMRSIYEWQSALYFTYNNSAMFLYYIPWVILLFGSFLFVRDHRELKGGLRSAAQTAQVVLFLLFVIFAMEFAGAYDTPAAALPTLVERHRAFWYVVVAVFLAANAHRLQFDHVGIAAMFFALSMRHNRSVTDAVVGTLPTLGHNLTHILERVSQVWRRFAPRDHPAAVAAWGAVMVFLGLFTFQYGYFYGYRPASVRESGMGIASNMPVEAVDYIARTGITGRCVPSYNAAAMLIHRTWPDVKVAMDSRNDVYGEALYNEYMGAIINRQGELPAYVAKWDPDFFLVTYGSDRSPAFHAWLRQSPEWRLVYFDDRQLVYLRARPRFAEILARDAFSLIDPTTPVYQAMKPDRAQEWHDEAARAYRNAPGSWTARQYLAKSLMLLNRLDEAEQHLRAIAESLPWAWFAWVDIGVVNLMQGNRDAAIDAFERCLAISPQQEVCRQYLGRARGTAP